MEEPGGFYHFVNRNSGKCLDVPGAATGDSVQFQQYTCNGTAAQSFSLGTPPPTGSNPDLGPNVSIFDPSTPASTIQSRLNTVFSQQQTNQFGGNRFALLFKPGTYSVDVNVGFYTQVLGLGLLPDQVTINGRSSGGLFADTKIDAQVRSGSQQQWLTRNTEMGSWTGANWNMVFVGATNAPAGNFPSPPYTRVATTPVVREKPFLYVDQAGNYQVFVPSVRTNSTGTSWSGGNPAGTSLPLSQFFIVKPGHTAANINAALAAGQDLLVTPGVYHLNDTIRVTRANTVVLGLGLATFIPDNGVTAMTVADVDGVKIAGVLFDAGTVNSPMLLQVGPSGSTASHAANPTSLHDVYFRVGGAAVGKATQSLVVNSNNVIGDHLWIWRGDHGSGIGWNSNTAANGLTVNGNDVTMYGLFVEHYQQYQTVWNGNGGRTYFYQNEMPYDPPNQAAWMNGTTQGYAAYKVAPSVTTHEAWGLGSYCYFNVNPGVVAARAFEVPNTPGVRFHNMVTVSLGGVGTIRNIINTIGGPSNSTTNVANLVNYP